MAIYNIPERPKNPDDNPEVYRINFTKYLRGASIASIVDTTIPSGITQSSVSFVSPYVYLALSGGTSGETYKCSVRIATDDSVVRRPERSINVVVQPM